MLAGLKPYPERKDSGVPRLGEVPEGWGLRRIKTLFREKDKRSGDGRGVLLSLTRAKGIVPQSDASGRLASAEDLSKYKECQPGDLIMNRMQAWSGMFAVSSYEGLVSPDYSVFSTIVPSDVNYFVRLFKTPVLVDQFAQRSKGIGSGFNRLYTPDFGAVHVVVPSLLEQAAIVHFLDHADRRIQRYIRAKQKLINLLAEQKQGIIHHAVTRGLDPKARLKPSGVAWLGEVPAHWEVLPLRRRWIVTDCKHLTVPFVEDGVPLASVREVQSFCLRLDKAKRTTEDWYRVLIEGGRAPKRGDLIYCRNVSVGATALVDTDEPLAMGQDVCLIRSSDQCQRFLNYYLHSSAMARQLALLRVGSTFDRINIAEVKSLITVVPPRSEQDAIAAYLDEEFVSVDRATKGALDAIALLREYRTRLIADVVTGKLDVREAAAQLPDEGEEPEPLDESDAPIDGEDESADDLYAATEEVES